MKRSTILVGLTILLAGCATSSPTQQKVTLARAENVADNPTAKLDDNTLVCETYEVTGSHMRQTICQAAREREINHTMTQNLLGKQGNFQRSGN